jgi:hypothetical protein
MVPELKDIVSAITLIKCKYAEARIIFAISAMVT